MNRKQHLLKFLLTLFMGLVSAAGFAANPADGDNLYVFTKQSDAPAIYSLDDLDKITFSDTGINFWNTKWPTEYAYGNFRLITFKASDNPNGIESIAANESDVVITYDHQKEALSVESGKLLSGVVVYDVQGRPVAIERGSAYSYQLSLSMVPRGIYVVKVNGSSVSQKIVK